MAKSAPQCIVWEKVAGNFFQHVGVKNEYMLFYINHVIFSFTN